VIRFTLGIVVYICYVKPPVKYVVSNSREKNLTIDLLSTVCISESKLDHKSRRHSSPSSQYTPKDLDPEYWFVGMKVDAKFMGKARRYPGVIDKIRRDGTYDICYDDVREKEGRESLC
jgi:hypothetical protein